MKMECRQIEELLMDFLYEELEPAQMTAYRGHLGECQKCAGLLAGYERTRAAMRKLPEMEPPMSITERLLAEAAAAAKGRQAAPVATATSVVGVPAPRMPRPVERVPGEESGGFLGWLSGLFRPLAASPAFAAVASLVLVGGVAGALYMRGVTGKRAADSARASATAATSGEHPKSEAPADTTTLARNEQGIAAATPAPAAEPPADPLKLAPREQGVVTVMPEANADAPRARLATPEESDGYMAGSGRRGGTAAGGGGSAPGSGSLGDSLGGAATDDRAAGAESENGVGGADKNDGAREEQYRERDKNAPVETRKPSAPAQDPAPAPQGRPSGGKAAGPSVTQTTPPAAPPQPPKDVAPQPERKAPAKPTAKSPAPDRGDSAGAAGGMASGVSMDEDAEAMPSAGEATTAAPRTGADKKAKTESTTEKEARKLHGQARAKANTGDCKTALTLRDRIYRIDPTYYSNKVKIDPDLNRCATDAAKRKKQQDGALEKAPDAPAKPADTTK